MLVTYFVLKGIHPEWSSHMYREASMIVGAADMFIKMFMYFVHERVWNKIK